MLKINDLPIEIILEIRDRLQEQSDKDALHAALNPSGYTLRSRFISKNTICCRRCDHQFSFNTPKPNCFICIQLMPNNQEFCVNCRLFCHDLHNKKKKPIPLTSYFTFRIYFGLYNTPIIKIFRFNPPNLIKEEEKLAHVNVKQAIKNINSVKIDSLCLKFVVKKTKLPVSWIKQNINGKIVHKRIYNPYFFKVPIFLFKKYDIIQSLEMIKKYDNIFKF